MMTYSSLAGDILVILQKRIGPHTLLKGSLAMIEEDSLAMMSLTVDYIVRNTVFVTSSYTNIIDHATWAHSKNSKRMERIYRHFTEKIIPEYSTSFIKVSYF